MLYQVKVGGAPYCILRFFNMDPYKLSVWFWLAPSVLAAELSGPACQLLTSGLSFSSQPLLWDRVQQKMGQAVNYHKCSGK